MALVSGIIALNTKNQFSTFKRIQIKDLKIKLPTKLQYEIGIDQSTSCTGIYIQDTKNIVNILLELEFANKDKKDYFADIFNLISRLVKGQTVNLIVCEKPVPKDVGSYTFRVLTELFGKLEVFLEFNPDLAKTELQSIYPQAWKSRIIDKSKGTGRINTKLCCAEDICDKKPLLKNYLYNSPAKDLDGFDACGILIGYKKCAYTDNGTPKIYGVVEKRHISRVYYRYVDISNVKTQEDFTEAVFGFLGETVSYFQPKLKVYNSDNHYNLLKNIKMASSTYSFTVTQLPNKVIEPLRWNFEFEYDSNKVMFAYILKKGDFKKSDLNVLDSVMPWHLEYEAIS